MARRSSGRGNLLRDASQMLSASAQRERARRAYNLRRRKSNGGNGG